VVTTGGNIAVDNPGEGCNDAHAVTAAFKFLQEGIAMRSGRLTKLTMVACLLVLTSISLFARVEVTGQSAVGMWRLDVGRSSYQNMPAPKFEQLVITTDEPKSTKWNIKQITPDGKSNILSYDGPVDSKFHPMMSSEAGATVAYTRTASGMQWTVKDKNGAVVETATGKVAPDGKTLTIKGTSQGPNGKGEFTAVYSRVQ
jgi:hypothetical protein